MRALNHEANIRNFRSHFLSITTDLMSSSVIYLWKIRHWRLQLACIVQFFEAHGLKLQAANETNLIRLYVSQGQARFIWNLSFCKRLAWQAAFSSFDILAPLLGQKLSLSRKCGNFVVWFCNLIEESRNACNKCIVNRSLQLSIYEFHIKNLMKFPF